MVDWPFPAGMGTSTRLRLATKFSLRRSSLSSRRCSSSLGSTWESVQRRIGGAISDVTTATMRMIEYISAVRIPRVKPMVATMISMAPRAFMPAPSDSASQ